uniref:Uncharacterized protein n=1 Tax=viral metagenome TaxID=1070528 RepID=A0A6M3KGE8_9ZZZZ
MLSAQAKSYRAGKKASYPKGRREKGGTYSDRMMVTSWHKRAEVVSVDSRRLSQMGLVGFD